MRNSLNISLLFITLMIAFGSCKRSGQNEQLKEVLSDWRYFGEEAPGQKARIFSPTVISTNRNERDLAMSPTGSEIFYSLVLPKSNFSVIVYLYNDGAFWSQTLTAPFSGQYSDLEPSFSPDGKRLFFVSKRPLNNDEDSDDWNIWFVNKTNQGWSVPEALGAPVNDDGDEYYPSLSNNGNLYFTAHREDSYGAEDIYMSKFVDGVYTAPVNLGIGVNTNKYEFNACIAPDESYLLFSSFDRDDELGGGDLYISFRVNDTTWTAAKNLGPDINSDKLDYCPFVSPDGKYLFFTSQRVNPAINDHNKKSMNRIYALADGIENGFGNIYWVSFDPARWK